MSHDPSDPALNSQFRRNWRGSPSTVSFLGELSERDLDRIALARGERILRCLPANLIADLRPEEKRALARAFGRPWLRHLQERRSRDLAQVIGRPVK